MKQAGMKFHKMNSLIYENYSGHGLICEHQTPLVRQREINVTIEVIN